MRTYLFAAALAMTAAATLAETRLSGDLVNSVIRSQGNPYIVKETIVIPPGSEVVVKEGSVFLFEPFSGIEVRGKLTVEGTAESPVVFTSALDNEYNPASKQPANPFDWNGILVAKESAGAILRTFILRYSVYGVKAQTPNVQIQNARFRQNGQLHFTIDDKIQYVQDDLPFSYGSRQIDGSEQPQDQQKPKAAASGESKKEKKEKPKTTAGSVSRQKKIFRYGCLGLGVAGVGTSVICAIVSGAAYNDAQQISTDWQADMASAGYSPPVDGPRWQADFDAATGRQRGAQAASIVTGALGVVGFVGFSLTFFF